MVYDAMVPSGSLALKAVIAVAAFVLGITATVISFATGGRLDMVIL